MSGGEKLATFLGDRIAAGANPALGLRAIRLALREPALLETQLAAILRAGAHGPVRILLPMISSPARSRGPADHGQGGAPSAPTAIAIGDPLPEVGVMVEVPGAALAADSLARESSFRHRHQ